MSALFEILMAIVVACAAATTSLFGLALEGAEIGRPAAEAPRAVKRSSVAIAPEALAVVVVRR